MFKTHFNAENNFIIAFSTYNEMYGSHVWFSVIAASITTIAMIENVISDKLNIYNHRIMKIKYIFLANNQNPL